MEKSIRMNFQLLKILEVFLSICICAFSYSCATQSKRINNAGGITPKTSSNISKNIMIKDFTRSLLINEDFTNNFEEYKRAISNNNIKIYKGSNFKPISSKELHPQVLSGSNSQYKIFCRLNDLGEAQVEKISNGLKLEPLDLFDYDNKISVSVVLQTNYRFEIYSNFRLIDNISSQLSSVNNVSNKPSVQDKTRLLHYNYCDKIAYLKQELTDHSSTVALRQRVQLCIYQSNKLENSIKITNFSMAESGINFFVNDQAKQCYLLYGHDLFIYD